MKAYMLITIHTGQIEQVVEHLRRVDGVIEANMAFGPYDAVAVVEAEDIKWPL
jgi:nitrate reductase NapAB chaperone NapD